MRSGVGRFNESNEANIALKLHGNDLRKTQDYIDSCLKLNEADQLASDKTKERRRSELLLIKGRLPAIHKLIASGTPLF